MAPRQAPGAFQSGIIMQIEHLITNNTIRQNLAQTRQATVHAVVGLFFWRRDSLFLLRIFVERQSALGRRGIGFLRRHFLPLLLRRGNRQHRRSTKTGDRLNETFLNLVGCSICFFEWLQRTALLRKGREFLNKKLCCELLIKDKTKQTRPEAALKWTFVGLQFDK